MGDGMPMGMMMGMDPLYMVVFVITMVVSMIAQFWIKSSFSKYSKIRTARGMTGAQAAKAMLDAEGITDVQIRRFEGGTLSDHYDPTTKIINLSPDVYDYPSIAAVGVACHEAGHALQHAKHYGPLKLRSMLVKPASIGARYSVYLIMAGLIFQLLGVAKIGLLLFGVSFLFQVVTLPVEINASIRSKRALLADGIITPGAEANGVTAVLTSAAFTYIAAAFSSLAMLLYYAYRLGLLGGRRNND